MCVAEMTLEQLIDTALYHRVSAETWRLEDECQQLLNPGLRALPAPDVPVYVVAPLSPEVALAAEANDLARGRVEERIKAMYAHPAPRHLNCGKCYAMLLRHEREGGGVEDMLYRPSCKRSDCPHCWRRRLAKTLRRAATVLLDADPRAAGHAPRLGMLYVAETTWPEWESFNRNVRRQVGDCGGLRVCRSDNTVLAAYERPFRGSRPLSPAETTDLVAKAIAEQHTRKHAFRLLGAWSERKPKEWRPVKTFGHQLDFEEVTRELETLGRKAHHFRSPDGAGLIWRADSEADADMLLKGCPTLAKEETVFSKGPKSDRPGRGAPTDPTAETDFDPGASPWG